MAGRKHKGYYVGANLKLIRFREYGSNIAPQTLNDPAMDEGSYTSMSLGFGVINGVQFYLWKHLTLDVLAGIGMINIISEKSYQPQYLSHYWPRYDFAFSEGADIRLAVNIGYRF